jgi:hypothetical protein
MTHVDQSGSYVTKTQLKRERHWTDRLIKKYLGEPDKLTENMHYKSGPPVQLYLIDRIERFENTPEFEAEKAKKTARSNAAKKAAETRRRRTEETVDALKIDVPRFGWDELVRRACRAYNLLQSERNGDFRASPDSEPKFIARICVNYLRHELTPYESHLDDVRGAVGAEEAKLQIKIKVLEAIAECYPELGPECFNQECKAED